MLPVLDPTENQPKEPSPPRERPFRRPTTLDIPLEDIHRPKTPQEIPLEELQLLLEVDQQTDQFPKHIYPEDYPLQRMDEPPHPQYLHSRSFPETINYSQQDNQQPCSSTQSLHIDIEHNDYSPQRIQPKYNFDFNPQQELFLEDLEPHHHFPDDIHNAGPEHEDYQHLRDGAANDYPHDHFYDNEPNADALPEAPPVKPKEKRDGYAEAGEYPSCMWDEPSTESQDSYGEDDYDDSDDDSWSSRDDDDDDLESDHELSDNYEQPIYLETRDEEGRKLRQYIPQYVWRYEDECADDEDYDDEDYDEEQEQETTPEPTEDLPDGVEHEEKELPTEDREDGEKGEEQGYGQPCTKEEQRPGHVRDEELDQKLKQEPVPEIVLEEIEFQEPGPGPSTMETAYHEELPMTANHEIDAGEEIELELPKLEPSEDTDDTNSLASQPPSPDRELPNPTPSGSPTSPISNPEDEMERERERLEAEEAVRKMERRRKRRRKKRPKMKELIVHEKGTTVHEHMHRITHSIPMRRYMGTHLFVIPYSETGLEYDEDFSNVDAHKFKFATNGCQVAIVTVDGEIEFLDNEVGKVDLKQYLDEQKAIPKTEPIEEVLEWDDPNNERLDEHTLEITTADFVWEARDDCTALLLTFWVHLDEVCIPLEYFGYLFSMDEYYRFRVIRKIEVDYPVMHCRISNRIEHTFEKRCCLVFEKNSPMTSYLLEDYTFTLINTTPIMFNYTRRRWQQERKISDTGGYVPSESAIFPELSLVDLPGTVIRSTCECVVTPEKEGFPGTDRRWTAIGLDSGYVIVSACERNTNTIIDRKPLKFSGPISVLEFMPASNEGVVRLLMSSVYGPAAIWKYWLDDDGLQWEIEYMLENSHRFGGVICGTVLHDSLVIGTQKGNVVFYDLPMLPPRICPHMLELDYSTPDEFDETPVPIAVNLCFGEKLNIWGEAILNIKQTDEAELLIMTKDRLCVVQRTNNTEDMEIPVVQPEDRIEELEAVLSSDDTSASEADSDETDFYFSDSRSESGTESDMEGTDCNDVLRHVQNLSAERHNSEGGGKNPHDSDADLPDTDSESDNDSELDALFAKIEPLDRSTYPFKDRLPQRMQDQD